MINLVERVNINLAKKTIWLRIAQIVVNDRSKTADFKVPVHLAMGHEAIAIAIDSAMQQDDALLVTHRNIHYNLTRQGTLKEELDEYYLREEGLAQGRLGSMNLNNPKKGVLYASSILGNDMPVACGYALGNKLKGIKAATFVITGDGAIEEGAFYESLLFAKSCGLAAVFIVENNDWSLATRIEERRSRINVERLVSGFDIEYLHLESNDVLEYAQRIEAARAQAIESDSPIVVEVKLNTLGYWHIPSQQHPEGKLINYHCGPAPEVEYCRQGDYPTIDRSDADPLHVLKKHFSDEQLIEFSDEMLFDLNTELS